RTVRSDEEQRLVAIAGLGHHLYPELAQQRAQAGADQRVIVGEQDPQGRCHSAPRPPSGRRACTTVPPGPESMRSSPPTSATRSCMPSSPWLEARPLAAGTSNPLPSSRTESTRAPLPARRSMATAPACACRTTLVRSSWATRKQVVSTAG